MATDIIARGMITEYIAGTNINFTENRDGTVEISASGSISSEDSVARDAIGNHKSDTSNPHNVTPAQIGLGNVDNTSDLDKPISTAVQKAIDNKADKTVATTSTDGLMSAEDKVKLDAFEITKTGGKLHDKDIATTDLIPTTLPANGGNADTVNGHSVDCDVPADAVFTDTILPVDGVLDRNSQNAIANGAISDYILRQPNPNLLINPDFKINQRGVTGTFSETGKYFVDRWKLMAGTVTVTSDGSITLNGRISQEFETPMNTNEDGVIRSVSDGGLFALSLKEIDGNIVGVQISGTNRTISWVKLEYGRYDYPATPFVPPEPATELVKCQRYFQVVNLGQPVFAMGNGASTIRFGFTLPTALRANPTAGFTPLLGDYIWSITLVKLNESGNIKITDIPTISMAALIGQNFMNVKLLVNSADIISNAGYMMISAGGFKINLDAEIY